MKKAYKTLNYFKQLDKVKDPAKLIVSYLKDQIN